MQDKEIIHYFSDYIQRELGIVYDSNNLYQLQNRLDEVMKILNIGDLQSLYKDVISGSQRFNKQVLIDIATNNETSFFRDPRVFRSIDFILNELVNRCADKNEKLKIWSVASSTGQEPLSLAILIEEIIKRRLLSQGYQIYCTDISERVIKRAKEALYSDLEVHRGLTDTFLAKYFKQEGDRWRAIPQITRNLDYDKQNLLERFRNQDVFHIVLCRNVLIYQTLDKKKEILKRLTDSIIPGGYLILGAGESLIGLSTDFEQEVIDGAVFYRKKL